MCRRGVDFGLAHASKPRYALTLFRLPKMAKRVYDKLNEKEENVTLFPTNLCLHQYVDVLCVGIVVGQNSVIGISKVLYILLSLQ